MTHSKILRTLQQVQENFTADVLLDYLRQIADTPGPSQSIQQTRGPVIEKIVAGAGASHAVVDLNYLGTGNSVMHAKGVNPSILFIAHLDQISYLIDVEVERNLWRLIPNCKHLSQREVKGLALRYDLAKDEYFKVAHGTIFSEREEKRLVPFMRVEEGRLETGDRIVYESPLLSDGDLVKGNMDNAAGVAACLLAGLSIFQVAPTSKVGFVFSDEEEGSTDSLQYFARGVRRLMNKIDTPDVCFVIDGHGGRDGKDIGRGSFFTEKTGGGVATITPPKIFLKIKQVAGEIRDLGINLFEDEGRVSRSDDIPCLTVTPNVCSIGYPSMNRHHDLGAPTVSISDLVNLSKVIFWLGLSFDDKEHLHDR